MATQKRRVIYLSDIEWRAAKDRAAELDTSISSYLRGLIVSGISYEIGPEHSGPLVQGYFAKAAKALGVELPELPPPTRTWSGAARFNSQPFRPVPKRSGK